MQYSVHWLHLTVFWRSSKGCTDNGRVLFWANRLVNGINLPNWMHYVFQWSRFFQLRQLQLQGTVIRHLKCLNCFIAALFTVCSVISLAPSAMGCRDDAMYNFQWVFCCASLHILLKVLWCLFAVQFCAVLSSCWLEPLTVTYERFISKMLWFTTV